MVIGGAAGAAGGALGAGMPALGGAAGLALSGVASVAASSLIGSTTSFLTGGNTLSVGLLYYNFNTRGLENPFGGVTQSIFSALDIAGMVLPAVGGVASSLTKAARGTLPSASFGQAASVSRQSPAARQMYEAHVAARRPQGGFRGGGQFVPIPRKSNNEYWPMDMHDVIAGYSKVINDNAQRIGFYCNPQPSFDIANHTERASTGLIHLMQLNANAQLNLIESIDELEGIIDGLRNNEFKKVNGNRWKDYTESQKKWTTDRSLLSQPVAPLAKVSPVSQVLFKRPLGQTPIDPLPYESKFRYHSSDDEENFWTCHY
ncbi:hypothetical protein Barb6XT_02793 [Bacteroidales bacterium Barb6XT]|nr:hypothetical protein Barb6XT_02793 [Bacteroidales bacterium Barb6XT]